MIFKIGDTVVWKNIFNYTFTYLVKILINDKYLKKGKSVNFFQKSQTKLIFNKTQHYYKVKYDLNEDKFS